MFKTIRLKWRLTALVLAAMAGLILLGTLQIAHLRVQLLDDRKASLTMLIDVAVSTAREFQAAEATGTLNREEAQRRAADVLRGMRFQGKEYFYVYDSKGIGIMHPIRPDYVGKSHWDRQDTQGGYPVRALVNAAVDKIGFVSTLTARPGSDLQIPKLHFVSRYEPWDWVIGTGLYIDDLDAVFHRQLRYAGITVLAVLAVVGAIAWRVAHGVLGQIGGEPASAMAAMQRVAAGDLTSGLGEPRDGSLLGELERLMRSLRTMIGEVAASARHSRKRPARSTGLLPTSLWPRRTKLTRRRRWRRRWKS